ncbi:hypothetical protein D3C72_2471550 [compost metagenome]
MRGIELVAISSSQGWLSGTGAAKASGLVPWNFSAPSNRATMESVLVVAKVTNPFSAPASA